jgi:transcription antitermination factor NusG
VRLWVVAVTWPRYERRVARAFAREGFEFYLPKVRTPHQRIGPLFPRYIFAGPPEQWVALRQIYGVSRLLRSGERLATVPDECVTTLRAREDREGLVRLPRALRFRVGQRVRITLGAFTGLSGIYIGNGKRNRDFVSLATVGTGSLPAGNLIAE